MQGQQGTKKEGDTNMNSFAARAGRVLASAIMIGAFGSAASGAALAQAATTPSRMQAHAVNKLPLLRHAGISEAVPRSTLTPSVVRRESYIQPRVTGNPPITVCATGADYSTIQAAINAASSGDTIDICAGTYTEDLDITQSVTLNGAGEGQTIIEPFDANPDPGCSGSCLGSSTVVVLVGASNVTISNLTVNGDNPGLPGVTVGGVNIDAHVGILSDFNQPDPILGMTVTNVIVENIYERGIEAGSTDGTYDFNHDTVTNVQGDPSGSIAMYAYLSSGDFVDNTVSYATDAIHSNWTPTFGVTMEGNTVTHSGSGLETDNSGEAGTTDTISGNTVSQCNAGAYGITVFAPYGPVNVTNNSVSGCAIGLSSWASNHDSGSSLPAVPTITFSHNLVNGQGVEDSIGAVVSTDKIGYGCQATDDTFTSNTIENATNSFYTDETNIFSYYGYTDCALPGGLSMSAHFNRIAGNSASASGSGAFGNGAVPNGWYNNAQNAIDAGNNWWGCNAGPGSSGCDAISSGVNATPWLELNISASPQHVALSGTSTLTASITQNSAGTDTSSIGLIPDGTPISWSTDRGTLSACDSTLTGATATCILTASNVPDTGHPAALVDSQSAATTVTWRPDVRVCPGDFTSIQAGIDAANPGDTVTVCAGTYPEHVSINKSITLVGPNSGINPNTGIRTAEARIVEPSDTAPDGTKFAISIDANNVTVDGLTIDGHSPSAPSGAVNADEAVVISGSSNIAIQNDIIENFQKAGIDAGGIGSGSNSSLTVQQNLVTNVLGQPGVGYGEAVIFGDNSYGTITDNVITAARRGIQIDSNYASPASSVLVSGNYIDATQMGIWDNNSYGSAGPVTIQNNTITSSSASTVLSPAAIQNYAGIFLSSQWDTAGAVALDNNTISGKFNDGILAWNNAKDSIVQGGSIDASQMQAGVLVQTLDDPYGEVYTGGQGVLTLQDIAITHAPIGVWVDDNGNGCCYASVGAVLTGSTVTGSGTALKVTGPTASITAHFDRIVGNTVGVSNTSSAAVDVTNDWWGCNGGPNHTGCDSTSSSVNANPWLVLSVASSPTTILPGGSSMVTADLTHNSSGANTATSGYVPDNTAVRFTLQAGSHGSLLGCATSTTHGVAQCSFSTPQSTPVPSVSTVTVAVDNASVSTVITVSLRAAVIHYLSTPIHHGANVRLSATLTNSLGAGIAGRSLKFSLGKGGRQQTCQTGHTNASGLAHCVIGDVQALRGSRSLVITFAGDTHGANYVYAPTSLTVAVTVR
jgi:hypothetical protein